MYEQFFYIFPNLFFSKTTMQKLYFIFSNYILFLYFLLFFQFSETFQFFTSHMQQF